MAKKTKNKSKSKQLKTKEVVTKWDNLDIDALKCEVGRLESEKEKAVQERIKAQTEHDAVLSYYNVAKQRNQELQDIIRLERFKLDELVRDHREEVQVYLDKIEHLEYVHMQNLESVSELSNQIHKQEENQSKILLDEAYCNYTRACDGVTEKKVKYVEKTEELKQQYQQELEEEKQRLTSQLDQWLDSCASREQEIEEALDLKCRARINESNEIFTKNLSDLEKKHEELFNSTKAFWEKQIEENVALIAKLKLECDRLDNLSNENHMKAEAVEKENESLITPLAEMTSQLNDLKKQVKTYERNKQHLRRVDMRLVLAQERARAQENENQFLEEKYFGLEKDIQEIERDMREVKLQLSLDCFSSVDAVEDHFSTLSHFSETAKNMVEDYLNHEQRNHASCKDSDKRTRAINAINDAMSEVNRLTTVHDLLLN